MRILLGLFLFLVSPSVLAADPVFKYDPDRAPTGVVYHYQKSNIDGSHASLVSIYRPTPGRIESLKYDRSAMWATIVEANINWETFNVSYFRTRYLRPDRPDFLNLDVNIEADGTFTGSFPGARKEEGKVLSGRLEAPHWHSYDFDFASLGAVFPHLTDPEIAFSFMVGDPLPGPRLPVEVSYVGIDTHGGFKSRKYAIDGPGLEDRGGYLWADFDQSHLVGFEIDLPDEDGYDSNKLLLLDVEAMSPEMWACFRDNMGRRDSC